MATASPTEATIRVVPCERAWRVISDPSRERMIDRLCTRERAVEHALQLAAELTHTNRRVRVCIEDESMATVEELDVGTD